MRGIVGDATSGKFLIFLPLCSCLLLLLGLTLLGLNKLFLQRCDLTRLGRISGRRPNAGRGVGGPRFPLSPIRPISPPEAVGLIGCLAANGAGFLPSTIVFALLRRVFPWCRLAAVGAAPCIPARRATGDGLEAAICHRQLLLQVQ